MMVYNTEIKVFYWKLTERIVAYQYYDAMHQNSNWGYREIKHKRSKRAKNSYIGYYRICINADVFMYTLQNL